MIKKATIISMAVQAAIFGIAPAYAQSEAASPPSVVEVASELSVGTLVGVIRDSRGNYLNGASVRIEQTGRDVSTDSQGRFRITNLESGTYQITVRYLGYNPQTIDTNLGTTAGARLSVAMEPVAADRMEIVNVYGTRGSQKRGLNAQRVSENIKTVLSSDYLGRFPDNNVAEAMQRMSGAAIQRDQGEGRYVNVRGAPLEYSNVSIDGVVLPSPDGASRAIDLDTIPADVIAALELTKAITPDMDADAIAGNINIVTQGALDTDGMVARAYVSGGRNDKGNGEAHRAGATFGTVLNEARTLGFLVSANNSRTNRVTDNVEHEWIPNDDGVFLPDVTEFKDYEVRRSRVGITARMDYVPNEASAYYLSHTYSRFEDAERRDTLEVGWGRYTPESTSLRGVAGRATFDKELRNRTVVNNISSTVFGGRNDFGKFNIDYSVAYSEARQKYPDRDYLIYRETSRPAVAYDFTNPDLPVYQVLDGDGGVVRNDFNFPLDDFNFRRFERRFGDAQDEEQAYAFNLSIPGTMGEAFSTLKFGAKARLKEKFNDQDRFRNSRGTGAPSISEVAINRQSAPFGGIYNNGPKLRGDFVEAFGPSLENEDYRLRVKQSITSDYRASEDTLAVYGMHKLEWESTSLIYGLRLENTETLGEAAEFDDDTETATALSANNSYTKAFPSVHLRHELDNGVILRAAYSTGISRPNFEDLAPFVIIEDRESGRGEIELGNVGLRPAYAHSFDLMGEYYLEPLGIFGAGVFYKDISDPIFNGRSLILGGEFDGFQQSRPENGDNGKIYGFEVNWQQRFDNLPGLLGGTGIAATYTYSDSEADLPFGAGSTTLAGTSKHSFNLALQFDTNRLSSQLAYNYRSEYVDSFNTSDPGRNIFWDDRGTLDLTASFFVTDQYIVFLEATNLTDTKAVRYQGDRSRSYEHEQFGFAWQVGFRFNL